jgi:peptidoglycan hydrolase CwlO-like protein
MATETALESAVRKLRDTAYEVGRLRGSVFDGQVSDCEWAVTDAQIAVNNLAHETSELRADLTALDSELEDVASKLSQLKAEVDDVAEECEEALDRLAEELAEEIEVVEVADADSNDDA